MLSSVQLSDQEKEMIKLRYGFDGGKERTYGEIGLIFGVTVERARQIMSTTKETIAYFYSFNKSSRISFSLL